MEDGRYIDHWGCYCVPPLHFVKMRKIEPRATPPHLLCVLWHPGIPGYTGHGGWELVVATSRKPGYPGHLGRTGAQYHGCPGCFGASMAPRTQWVPRTNSVGGSCPGHALVTFTGVNSPTPLSCVSWGTQGSVFFLA